MHTSKTHFYSPKGLFFVEGADAATFLQGQFSQDLRQPEKSSTYGLWLNQKGKILADSFILKLSDTQFLVTSYFGETDVLRDNLEKRIIMDEVETRPADSGGAGVSVWGDAIRAALEIVGLESPEVGAFTVKEGAYVFWGRRGSEANLEILFLDPDDRQQLEKSLIEGGTQILGTDELSILGMRSGRFEVGRDIQNTDLPQEVGLDKSAVSYVKGCYIGQEVMARLKSIGRPRRSLECVSLSGMLEGEGPWGLIGSEGTRAGELRRIMKEESAFVGSAMLKRSVENEHLFEVEGQSAISASRVSKDSAE